MGVAITSNPSDLIMKEHKRRYVRAKGRPQSLPLNSESDIRRTLKRLSEQRVAVVLQPGNIWVVENAVEDDEQTDAALKTAYMRGWVEPIENAVPKAKLAPDGSLPRGELFQRIGPLWRLTEGGWAVVNRTQLWTLFAIILSLFSFAVSVGSLMLSLKQPYR